jgi:hypothetical protein
MPRQRMNVVVLIIAHKQFLSDAEKASLKQCYKVLGKHDIVLICPKGLDVAEYIAIYPQAKIDFIDPVWQSTYAMFNRLKIEPFLYERYKQYEYILFYELDAWVFSDELAYWSKKNYDYVGAPWVREDAAHNLKFIPGQNGGFSLRRVKSYLKVLHSFKIIDSPSVVWKHHRKFHNGAQLFLRVPLILLRMLGWQNNFHSEMKKADYNEDVFWSKRVPEIYPDFTVAPNEDAMKFAFEQRPSVLYRLNQEKLPFGCHAWPKYEPEFWKQFMDEEVHS